MIKMQFGLMLLGVALLGLAIHGAPAASTEGAGFPISTFEMGASQQTVLTILGKPTNFSQKDETGKEIWYYNSATVTFVNGKVIGWRKFVEKFPSRAPDAPPLHLWSTKADVLAALGFPPTALHYQQGLRLVKRPCGDEEWQYSVVTVIFQGDVICGWRNLKNTIISVGAAKEKTPMIALGANAKQVADYAGTPVTLVCFTDNGDQLWNYEDGQVFLRAGKVVWMGPYPQTEQPTAGTPAPDDAKTDNTQPPAAVEPPKEEDKGFVGEANFGPFCVAFQTVLQQMLTRNPKIILTSFYQGMEDCINGISWVVIKGRATADQGYNQGVQQVYDAYQQYLKTLPPAPAK